MSDEILALTLSGLLLLLLLLVLVANTVSAWMERKVARQLAEAFDLVRPVMEDIRRLEPHLDESIDLALVRMVKNQEQLRRLSVGRATPIGLIPRRKKKR